VDDARGANVARLFAPQLDAAASPLGQLELNAAIAVYWGAGLHAGVVSALAAPVDVSATSGLELDAVCAAAGTLARAGLGIAGPAVVACVLVDALMGIVNRASPAANVFSLALPIKLAAAAFVTAVGLPGRGAAWAELWSRHDEWLRSAASLGGL
jgi:type III secretion protein T